MTETRQTYVSPKLADLISRGLSSVRRVVREVIEADVADTPAQEEAIERAAGSAGALVMLALECDREDRQEEKVSAGLRDTFAARSGHPPAWYMPAPEGDIAANTARLASWPYWYADQVLGFRAPRLSDITNPGVNPCTDAVAATETVAADGSRTLAHVARGISPVAEAVIGGSDLRAVAPERVGPVDPIGTDPLVECLSCGERAPQSKMEANGAAACRNCGSARVRLAAHSTTEPRA